MLKLYAADPSPFARKVRVLLLELDRLDEVEVVTVAVKPTDPGALPTAQVPLGKIPALERPEGPTLYDSRVITRYLNDVFGGALYPPAPRLWDTLTLEATADGIMDAAVLMVYEARIRPEDLRYEVWVEAQWAKVLRALDAVEARWMATLAGPFDMGQIALAVALGYLDFRQPDRDWRVGRPQLATWAATAAARPAMQATVPTG